MQLTLKTLKILILIIFLSGTIFANSTLDTDTRDKPNTIKKTYWSITKNNIRIVLEGEKTFNCQLQTSKKPSKIEVDLFNLQFPKAIKKIYRFKDPLIKQMLFANFNIRQAALKVYLKYELPQENINIFTMDNPHRLVIDIKRSYIKKSTFNITQNIVWTKKKMATFWGYLLINELAVNIKNEDVALKVALAEDEKNKCKKLSEIAKENNALIAVNGGFYSSQEGSLGLVIIDEEVKYAPVKKRPPRTAFGITKEKKIIIDRVKKIQGKIISLGGKIWDNIIYALGAGPRIIKEGNVHLTTDFEMFGRGGNNITKSAARSILGVLDNENIVLATFSSYKDNHAQGIKLESLAKYLLQLNIKDAVNLDGGGSTGMWIKNILVSLPPGGGYFERKIANAILIYDKSPFLLADKIELKAEIHSMLADGKEKINIEIEALNEYGQQVQDGTEVNLTASIGYVMPDTVYTKDGKAEFSFTSQRKAGKAVIKASSGIAEGYTEIYLNSGDPFYIFTEGSGTDIDIKEPVKKYLLKILITDEYLNPIIGSGTDIDIEDKDKSSYVQIESNNITDNTGTCEALITIPENIKKLNLLITAQELSKELELIK